MAMCPSVRLRALLPLLPALVLLAATGASTVTMRDAWVRATPPGAATAALYGVIENTGSAADRLVAVETDAADAAELHSMESEDGMMVMKPVAGGLAVPAGGAVTLKPGGYHIMLVRPARQIQPGDRVHVTLVFAQAGRIALAVPARAP